MNDESDVQEIVNLTPSPRLLEVIGDVDLTLTQCIAELSDNAFDEINSATLADPSFGGEVFVEVPKSSSDWETAQIVVSDNGRGMSLQQLELALKAGSSGNSRYGTLGLFGMGFNIATARLGNLTKVWTTRTADDHWLVVAIDLKKMQKAESFEVAVRREPKQSGEHGTRVTVENLRPEILQKLRGTRTVKALGDDLGDLYSYLLRPNLETQSIPDSERYSGDSVFGGAGLLLHLNGKRVMPRLPCVWEPSRTVTRSGREIEAVIPIDTQLTDGWACMACGMWHRHVIAECTECGSNSIEQRSRRIHGWLGIQRYFNTADYGVDVIRQGRKILIRSKEFFQWKDPDSLSASDVEVEYPSDLPNQGGRIVGEIHLDHVRVNYRKTDFERDTGQDWGRAITEVRGEAPLKPQSAKRRNYDENTSPMALLFQGFRRSDPGLNYLMPGDGKVVLLEQSKKWADKFHQGDQDFLTDKVWYAAAVEHERIKNGEPESDDMDSAVRAALTESGFGDLLPNSSGGDDSESANADNDGGEDETPEPHVETDAERFERYRNHGRVVPGMDVDIRIPGGETTHLRVVEVQGQELVVDGNGTVAFGRLNEGDLEVFVDGLHEVVVDFGKDVRDLALMQAADTIGTVYELQHLGQVKIFTELLGQFPDQRVTSTVLRARCDTTISLIRDNLAAVIIEHPQDVWDLLSPEEKESIENVAASSDPHLDWRHAAATGDYADFLPIKVIQTIVREKPDLVFDGPVFGSKWATWDNEKTKSTTVKRIVLLLDEMDAFLSNEYGIHGITELKRMHGTLDQLAAEITEK